MIILQHRLVAMTHHYRLSNENVSSVYDDRLDKIDPEGTLVPGQRRYSVSPASQSIEVSSVQEHGSQRGRDSNSGCVSKQHRGQHQGGWLQEGSVDGQSVPVFSGQWVVFS